MRRLIECGAVLGRNFVQVGLRGYWPPQKTFEWMQEQGMRWHLMHEVWQRGIGRRHRPTRSPRPWTAPTTCTSASTSTCSIPGFAPGTGTPEPGGLAPADLLRTVRALAMRANMVAMDVVEVAPAYDVSDNTVNNAHRVVFEALAGMAWRRREAAGGAAGPPALPH